MYETSLFSQRNKNTVSNIHTPDEIISKCPVEVTTVASQKCHYRLLLWHFPVSMWWFVAGSRFNLAFFQLLKRRSQQHRWQKYSTLTMIVSIISWSARYIVNKQTLFYVAIVDITVCKNDMKLTKQPYYCLMFSLSVSLGNWQLCSWSW